jgi:hypothetical protein
MNARANGRWHWRANVSRGEKLVEQARFLRGELDSSTGPVPMDRTEIAKFVEIAHCRGAP